MYYIDFVDDHFVVVCCFDMTISDYRNAPLSNLRSAHDTEYVYCADSYRDFVSANDVVNKLNTYYVKDFDNLDRSVAKLYSHFIVEKCAECGKYYIVTYGNKPFGERDKLCAYCESARYDDVPIKEFYGLHYVWYDSESKSFVSKFDATRTDSYEDTYNLSNFRDRIHLPEGLTDIKYSRNPDIIMETIANLNEYMTDALSESSIFADSFIVRLCKDCGKYYMVTQKEYEWLMSNEYNFPVRCCQCRQGNKLLKSTIHGV